MFVLTPSHGPNTSHVRVQHNPEKLAEVDTLLAKYGEQKLLSMVRKKYIHDPVRKKCAKSGCPAQNCARKHRQTAAPKPAVPEASAAVLKSSEGSPRVCVCPGRARGDRGHLRRKSPPSFAGILHDE